MSVPCWVRARDGALYKDPVLVLPSGFVRFVDCEPQLVVWLGVEPARFNSVTGGQWLPLLLEDAFGVEPLIAAYGVSSCDFLEAGYSVAPQTDPMAPPLTGSSATYALKLCGRIPRPTMHGGSALYGSRVGPGAILDFPAGSMDARFMDGRP